MQNRIEAFKNRLEAAAGTREADLILDNVKLVDVYTGEIRPASIAIYDGRIATTDPSPAAPCQARIDGEGQYALPGFIDTHMHIETTLLTPEALGEVISPWGSTALMVDAMEIANVAGREGLLALARDTENLPFRMYLEIPSRVPTAPGLETTGGVLDAAAVRELMARPESVSLGELDPSKILEYRDEYLQKILDTLDAGRICNGHAIGLGFHDLNTYACGHMLDDHECVTYEELTDRLRVGIAVLIREGSSERNARRLLTGIIEHGLDTDNLMFCTDDKHVNDIVREGHISYSVQMAIDLGMEPTRAIRMATLHAAKHFRMEEHLGSLTPGRFADILLLRDLRTIRPSMVFKGGKLVARDGAALPITGMEKQYPPALFDTVKLPPSLSLDDFAIPSQGKEALCRVIGLIPDQIINNEECLWLEVSGGKLHADLSRDILKLSVVERYGKNGRVSNAFVKGFGLRTGALAASVSHDHHNIVVVGTNDEDMLAAVREVGRLHGGFACAEGGRITGSLALPLGGLMSPLPAHAVMEGMEALNLQARTLGTDMHAPFMSLSFISLPTVPDLGLTDYGLIDVLAHKQTNLILETKS